MPSFQNAKNGSRASLFRLFLVSFASLFVEVMLIRWIGTEFRIFAYIQNLTLVACFLGFGLGCLQTNRKPNFLFNFWSLSLLAFIIDMPLPVWKSVLEAFVSGLATGSDLSVWAWPNSGSSAINFVAGSAMLGGVLLLVISAMMPLGTWVAGYLESSDKIVFAYTINLFGSLVGVWGFVGLSFLRLAPLVWFLVAIGLLFAMRPSLRKIGPAGWITLGACVVFVAIGGRPAGKVVWSPYQKLEVISEPDQNYLINVNNTGYMTIANLTPENLQKSPDLASAYGGSNSYDAPYRFVANAGNVLIVGSGAGNDVAAALRHGAEHVDAVEIDPAIYELGRTLHPEKPYQSPNVRVVLDDARDFMRRASGAYDLIVFALLDSHTQSATLSNMRIDNYVYTKESLADAKQLLKPSGVLVVKFEVQHDWIGQRFHAMLSQLFAHPPLVFYCQQVYALFPANVFVESQDSTLWTRASSPELAQFLAEHPARFKLDHSAEVRPTTDDWPYLYQRSQTIPRLYLSVSAILIVLALLLVRKRFAYRQRQTWEFFFLGAGFLLLETQMVSRLNLYFGSTWLVNCVALTFVLLVLMGANLMVEKLSSIPLLPLYGSLVFSLVFIYAVPWTLLPFGTRTVGVLLGLAFSIPLLFAGMIFTESFRRAQGAANLLGANILGAVAGGLAQNLSFVIGMKGLLLVASVFYSIASLARIFGAEPGAASVGLPVERASSGI